LLSVFQWCIKIAKCAVLKCSVIPKARDNQTVNITHRRLD